MQKKQLFAADVAVASISRSNRRDRRARVVDHQQLVRQRAQMHTQLRLQPHRHADAGHVRQAADDRLLLRPLQALSFARHDVTLTLRILRKPS